MDYTETNARMIDAWVDDGWIWSIPVTPDAYARALKGDWAIYMTPTIPVPHSWFGPLQGAQVLGLAAAGGQQMPLLTAAGAHCTVLDYSERMLDQDRAVATREGYAIEIIRSDMTDPLPFPDATFDLIVHPVSNCYIEAIEPVFAECYRVLRPGGILISGLDIGTNFFVDEATGRVAHPLPVNPLRDPETRTRMIDAGDGFQFSHTAGEQIHAQLRAGFRLTDTHDDTNESGFLHDMGIPSFLLTRAVKDT